MLSFLPWPHYIIILITGEGGGGLSHSNWLQGGVRLGLIRIREKKIVSVVPLSDNTAAVTLRTISASSAARPGGPVYCV